MQAVAYHGKRDVRVDTVPDPTIEAPTDAIVRITSSGICGSDLHLYEVLGAFLDDRQDRPVEACRQLVWALITGSEFRFNY